MSAKVAEATVVSEESEPTSEEVEQTSSETVPGSFAAAMLEGAEAEGHTIGFFPQSATEEKPKETETAEPEKSEPETEPEKEPEPTDEEKEPETETEPAAEKAEPEKKSIDDQLAEFKAKGEKPPWYLSRISEEAQKRRERTEDLRKTEDRLRETESELQQLRAQLTQVQAPAPTPDAPLADVYDEGGLQKLESTYEKILEFAEKHRDGAERVVVGKKSDGSEVVKDFTPEEVADMRYKADKALRKDIPQRRAYLIERGKADATAMEIYPEFKDGTSEMTKEALSLLRARPQLETLLGPEVLIWIGHALKGREQYLARNGNGAAKSPATNPAAEKIERAAKTKLAPTTTKSHSLPERKGADLAALNKQLEERGDAESADAYLAAILQPRRSGTAKKLEPIAE